MATVNLNYEDETIDTSNDSIVIMNHIDGVTGGCTLNTTGFAGSVIKSGHVVIKSAEGERKPMPVMGEAYAALPANHTYYGVVVATVKASDARVSVMTRGKVNQVASPYTLTAEIKAALNLIEFSQD